MDETTIGTYATQSVEHMGKAVFVVAALLQLIKKSPAVKYIDGWLPHLGMVISVGVCWMMGFDDLLLNSIVVSLTASGSYSLLRGNKIRDTPIPMEPPSL